VDIVPVAPHIAPVQAVKDYSDKAAHLVGKRFVMVGIPAHTVDRAVCPVCVVMLVVDSTDWAVVMVDSTD